MPRATTYVGVFIVAASTLMLEILLTRIISVIAWYHLAFFVISLAMLGMTAGAMLVFFLPRVFDDAHVPRRLAESALVFALSTPVAIGLGLSLPLVPVSSLMTFLALLLSAVLLALPFTASGVTLALALTRAGLPPGPVYAVDLCGAATGCVTVIPVLDAVDAPSAALAASSIAALGAVAFGRAAGRRTGRAVATAYVLLALAGWNAMSSPSPLRPSWVKGELEDASTLDYAGWNTHSRVAVKKAVTGPPLLWGPGATMPSDASRPRQQRPITIDGAAGTVMTQLAPGAADHDYLAWEVTSFAHRIRPSGPAAVIGVGGGRDVLEAVRVGHTPVVGIEINALIVDLHRNRWRQFSGLADQPGVELVADEARSYLSRDTRSYSVLTMALIDTWATTGAGAYSLSENGLYTVEAWSTFLDRLAPDGIFQVSRWFKPDSPGETTRMLALALEVLWQRGIDQAEDHLILVRSGLVATLLVSAAPFTKDDMALATDAVVRFGFEPLLGPGFPPTHPQLKALFDQGTPDATRAWMRSQPLDFTAPTDSRPFFFNMLKPATWLLESEPPSATDFGVLGNLQATHTLVYSTLASVLLTAATLWAPFWLRREELAQLQGRELAASLGYFALIGLGFMFVEIGLLSYLNVFLGHPTLALAVLLGGIILFTGVGSGLSSMIQVDRHLTTRAFPIIPAALVVTLAVVVPHVTSAAAAYSTLARVAVSLALLAPAAIGLGLCFPLGLRLVSRIERERSVRLGPWLWGINGASGVCASGLALGTSMTWGIPVALWVGAACYLALPVCTRVLAPRA